MFKEGFVKWSNTMTFIFTYSYGLSVIMRVFEIKGFYNTRRKGQ